MWSCLQQLLFIFLLEVISVSRGSVRHTCVWVHREVWVSLTDAVHQFGTAPVHTVISICSCHLDDRCT